MDDVLAIILGGGQGSRLFPLTQQRSKPAVPIGGKYRLIDVPISNCLHADLRRIFVLTLCLIAGFNPFVEHSDAEATKFEAAAKSLFKGAKLVGDIATCNQALVSGEIDFYLPGGTYSASLARADGQRQIRGVTPKKGPMDGKGGVSWIEITSVVNNPDVSPLAETFLEYVQDPEVAHRVAFAEGTFNPVAQMGNPDCFKLFTADELDIIQWDTLEEEMARSIEYDIVPDYDRLHDLMTAAKREA